MLLCVAAWCLAAQVPASPDFVISPTGDDKAPGTVSRPFRTLDHARDAVRSFRKAHPNLHRPVQVLLQSGVYELAEDLFNLTPEDSRNARIANALYR